jgi:hypothetical protein
MCLNLRTGLLRIVPLFLLAHSLSQSIGVLAETDPCELGPTSCERPGSSRFFQMAVWTYEEYGTTWQNTTADVDIPMFREAQAPHGGQPPGRSIMRYDSWNSMDPDPPPLAVNGPYVDWSRVLAVVIDEPYSPITDHDFDIGNGQECTDLRDDVAEIRSKLMNAVNALRSVAPRTRVWVNFTENDVTWMQHDDCPLDLNDSAFDVVSLDIYGVDFAYLEPFYDYFMSSNPSQQIALVPGTFYDPSIISEPLMAYWLSGYFDYANRMNQQCDIGLGNLGRTGNYDGCRVWIVAGWLANPEASPGGYRGLLHPNATNIRQAWRSQLAEVRRFGPRTFTAVDVRTLELLAD